MNISPDEVAIQTSEGSWPRDMLTIPLPMYIHSPPGGLFSPIPKVNEKIREKLHRVMVQEIHKCDVVT